MPEKRYTHKSWAQMQSACLSHRQLFDDVAVNVYTEAEHEAAQKAIAAHEAKRAMPEEWLSKTKSLIDDLKDDAIHYGGSNGASGRYAMDAAYNALIAHISTQPASKTPEEWIDRAMKIVDGIKRPLPDKWGEEACEEFGHEDYYDSACRIQLKALNALRAHISTPPAGMVLVPEELLRIGELIRTQDNRATDQPLFAVRQKSIVGGVDSDYTDKFSWVHDGEVVADDEEIKRLEEHWKANYEAIDGYERVGYVERYEFATGCFTEQGCKDYLARDAHNLKEPHIYAYGTYRNGEFQAVRDFLKSLPPPEAKEPK